MSEEKTTTTINILNLQNIVRIIDVAAERGAFKGNELSSVGRERDIIAAFVQENTPKETVTEESTADNSTTESN